MWDDLSNWNEYTKVFAAVFAMIAPPIVMAPYLALVSGRSMKEKHQTAMVGITGFVIMPLRSRVNFAATTTIHWQTNSSGSCQPPGRFKPC